MRAFVFIQSPNKARCTFLLQRGLAARTQRFCGRGKVYFISGWGLWSVARTRTQWGRKKSCPIWPLSLAREEAHLKTHTSKRAQKASSPSGGGRNTARSRGVEECDPGYPKQEPFLTRKVNVGLVSSGFQCLLPLGGELRSREIPAACWAAEWSHWIGETESPASVQF